MKKLFLLLGLLWSAVSAAQFAPGQLLTAAELNAQFALYAPLTGATFSGPLSATSITNTPISGSSGAFTTLSATSFTLPSGSALSSPVITGTITGNAATNLSGPATFGSLQGTSIGSTTPSNANFTAIGNTTPGTGSFTTLSANGTVSGTGFTNLLSPYATKASPTFTGTVTIPAGASISGYATLSSPTFTGTVIVPAATAAGQAENFGQSLSSGTVQLVTSSRAFSTSYTNSTGHPIYVMVSASNSTAVSSTLQVYLTSSLILSAYSTSSPPVAGAITEVGFIVPAGSAYQVNVQAGSPTLTAWSEIR